MPVVYAEHQFKKSDQQRPLMKLAFDLLRPEK